MYTKYLDLFRDVYLEGCKDEYEYAHQLIEVMDTGDFEGYIDVDKFAHDLLTSIWEYKGFLFKEYTRS